MIATVIALGNSALHWVPRGLTIGVNEYLMWGKQADVMLIVNAPHKFSADEMKFIRQHKGKLVTNSARQWGKVITGAEPLKHMGAFHLRVTKGRIYTSSTSPMVAISYAIQQGADEVILYGVDMCNHPKYKIGSKAGDHEIDVYKRFFSSCDKIGVKIYLGAWGTAFDGHLWKYVDPVEGNRTGHEFKMTIDMSSFPNPHKNLG